jgi:hypothetical protein
MTEKTTKPCSEKAAVLHGAGALTDMLDMIGNTDVEQTDHAVACILVANEMELRALLRFALKRIADDE